MHRGPRLLRGLIASYVAVTGSSTVACKSKWICFCHNTNFRYNSCLRSARNCGRHAAGQRLVHDSPRLSSELAAANGVDRGRVQHTGKKWRTGSPEKGDSSRQLWRWCIHRYTGVNLTTPPIILLQNEHHLRRRWGLWCTSCEAGQLEREQLNLMDEWGVRTNCIKRTRWDILIIDYEERLKRSPKFKPLAPRGVRWNWRRILVRQHSTCWKCEGGKSLWNTCIFQDRLLRLGSVKPFTILLGNLRSRPMVQGWHTNGLGQRKSCSIFGWRIHSEYMVFHTWKR